MNTSLYYTPWLGRACFLVVTGSILMAAGAAGATGLQVQAAAAATIPVSLRDDRFQFDCSASDVQMGVDGSLSIEGSTCSSVVQLGASGSLQFLENGSITHSCEFAGMTMNAEGSMVIIAAGNCFGDSDGDGIPDLIDPAVDTAATGYCDVQGTSPDETVSMSGANYAANGGTCKLPEPNRLVAANTVVGAANSPVTVDFYAKDGVDLVGATVAGSGVFRIHGDGQVQPAVRIWGPFLVEDGGVFSVHPSGQQ
ncbi:hypothetical protein [Thiolapillus sp.]